ncbi:hypothetical protein BCR32DRAFT_270075 [Anaeromyces robustus]|uniref:RING-CH-type domain-containing protein n=1 Tax=Anaeromyces robustus TaxID=1754192 RepID=A0A1Y1WYK0_9FUNG|nr:hypothetical protein BCR32DRAFT_270075 [Anaeromyces robustus]|eukprot:ORX78428.1 hypothetical protein BCR32DRAFT_270075 [Anaeromyces robustus]
MNDIEGNNMDFKSESNFENQELRNEDEEQSEYLKRKLEEIENEEKIKEAERIKKQQEYQAEFLNYLNNKKKQKIYKQLCAIWFETGTLKKIARKLHIIKEDDSDNDERFIAENMEFFKNNINFSDENINNIDTRVCRICFGGANEILESGKLISPCKCKGSMKYVHVNCLNEWRLASANNASYYQCDQCKYKYNFQRTKFAKILSNKFVIFLIATFITYLYIFFTGFILKTLIWYKNYKVGAIDFPKITFYDVGMVHHFYGFCIVGLYGVFKMTYSYLFDVSTVTNSIFRLSRGKRNREDDQLTLLLLLIIGCIKFMYDEYKSVYKKSKESLTILEERILEVNEDDDEDDDVENKKSK